MRARFKGWCRAGRHPVKAGDIIERYGSKGWAHTGCMNSQLEAERAERRADALVYALESGFDSYDTEAALAAADEREYQQGRALGEHIALTRQYFGEEAAAAEEYAWAQKLGDY